MREEYRHLSVIIVLHHQSVALNGLVGGVATYSLMQTRFDLAFLGTLELDVENDCVSTFDAEDAMIKRTVLENSERTYVVADSHKFMARGNYRYARLSDFTGLGPRHGRP